MKHLDKRIYAGTAILAAVLGLAVLVATRPVDIDVIEAASAATHAPVVAWKGLRGVVVHEGAPASGPEAAK